MKSSPSEYQSDFIKTICFHAHESWLLFSSASIFERLSPFLSLRKVESLQPFVRGEPQSVPPKGIISTREQNCRSAKQFPKTTHHHVKYQPQQCLIDDPNPDLWSILPFSFGETRVSYVPLLMGGLYPVLSQTSNVHRR
jgi:hypothetical protein